MIIKKKHSLMSVLLFLCLFFSLSGLVSAEWRTEDGATTYYSNGQKAIGLKTISKKKYLFDGNGRLITNQITKYNGKLYVSRADGTLITGWGKYKGKTYYAASSGVLKTGLCKRNSNYYYFDPANGAMAKKAWITIGKKTYYFSSNGKAVRNKVTTINKNKYYFNSKGELQKGLQRIGKYYYVFGATTGKMLSGSIKYGKFYYYLNPKTGRAITNTWKKIKGARYYYNSMGRRQTGWLVLGSKKYYLDPARRGAMATGTKKINGKTYTFGKNGYVTYNSSGNIVIQVNRKKCVVTIYDNGIPVKAMACSVGRSGHETPVGVFTIKDHLAWAMLDGPSLGQYSSHFLPEYLFHSVPMHTLSRNPYKVEANDYNNLGKPASAGCVRLCIADAKWIYYNVPVGSTVVISDNAPTPLGKPTPVRMPKRSVGADPTDDFKNPAGYDVTIK